MNYNLVTAVWELTMGCNMRCKHCGSRCSIALPDELTTTEALNLCDDLGDLGLKIMTLSGGEPTTRKDWPEIASRLNEHDIIVNMITNGWLVDQDFIEKAKKSGLRTVCISIDGLNDTHDLIRKAGSYKKSIDALEKLKINNISTSVITSINKRNIKELDSLYSVFEHLGVSNWQLQFALPMGNFSEIPEWMISPSQINDIIDFAYRKIGGVVLIALSDCIGYYSHKDIEINENFLQDDWSWSGCGAGKHVIGILQNGDIVGCTSIRNKEFIAGNIRERSLRSIWEDTSSFNWNRAFTKQNLEGFCNKCIYSDICLEGCSNVRYCTNGTIYSENNYCSYNIAAKEWIRILNNLSSAIQLDDYIHKFFEIGQTDLADIALSIKKERFNE